MGNRMSAHLAATVAAAEEALADLSDVGGDSAVIAGIPCLRLPVPYAWGVQARPMMEPTAVALAAALAWLDARRPGGGTVTTRAHLATRPVFADAGLRPVLVLGAMVRTAEPAAVRHVPGLEIGPARSVEEFRRVYASFGTDLAAMIGPPHLAAPAYLLLVARLGGAPVACAQVRWAGGTAHVFSVAVLPELRGLGIGTAISAAATREAAARGDVPVWLHAEAHVQPLYHRLGYRLVDDHVQLQPAVAR